MLTIKFSSLLIIIHHHSDMSKDEKNEQIKTLLADPQKNQEVINRLLETCTAKQRASILTPKKPKKKPPPLITPPPDYSKEFKGEIVYEQIQIDGTTYYKDTKGAIVNNNNKLVATMQNGEPIFLDEDE